ncbi:tripartite tricarboxylate transporter permease [Sporomusa termitida]|uniref:Tripartite tricarboxylate transporter TctA family protein n=1 Tax=Sporomusa termitida TaxID=2377 RepID=A0A517DWY2_9FIRM|nr:tripartite tricarboxylate transporter permease [Sporomusa termitida]QDR81868.1 Tripartite tricarboxylate transporter TctA family protein [Sporomusa termitida]
MIESIISLGQGFLTAVTPINLLMAVLGAFIGTFVGVLPGLGPTSAIAMLLPVTSVLEPSQAIIMLAGIYYGSMYGGSTTAILLNIPGEASSVPTCLDGYQLARQGRGGPALGIAAIGSFIAGMVGLVGLVFFAPFLAEQAIKFGPPERFAVMVLALTVTSGLSGGSLVKAAIMGLFGFMLSLAGLGTFSGLFRFQFGIDALSGGFEMVSIVIGLFAITEVLKNIGERQTAISPDQIGNVYPSRSDLKQSAGAIAAGSVIGFVMGLLPGCSAAVTSFLSYDIVKKFSKRRSLFGKGAIEGVAAPEAANNATSSAGFIPLLSLGIPASPPLAVLLAGLMIYGVQPGPLLFSQQGGFVWTVIASMIIGNVALLLLNLPLIGLWARLTRVPFGVMGPVILMLSVIGAYSVRNSLFDVLVAVLFGFVGYFLYKFNWPVMPLILCFILGPMLEQSFIQSMSMSAGSFGIFFTRPLALAFLVVAALMIVISGLLVRRTKQRLQQEGSGQISPLS